MGSGVSRNSKQSDEINVRIRKGVGQQQQVQEDSGEDELEDEVEKKRREIQVIRIIYLQTI